MSYRLIENVYECDENGQPTANLKHCLPVPAGWRIELHPVTFEPDRVLLLVNGQWTDITEQTSGVGAKFTLQWEGE